MESPIHEVEEVQSVIKTNSESGSRLEQSPYKDKEELVSDQEKVSFSGS